MNLFQIIRNMPEVEKYNIEYDVTEGYTFMANNDSVLQIKPADAQHLQDIFDYADKYGYTYIILIADHEKPTLRVINCNSLSWMDKTMYRINKRLEKRSRANLKAV